MQYGSVNLISRIGLVRAGGLCITSSDYPAGTLREQSLANRTVLKVDGYDCIFPF